MGEAGGVSWWQGTARRRAALSGVRDLGFDPAGVLWIATDAGLYAWRRGGRPVRHTLRGGETSNAIRRLAVSSSGLLLATDGGAYWTSGGRIFQRLRPAGAARPISHVALRSARPGPAGEAGPGQTPIVEAWLFGADRLTRVRGIATTSGLRITDRRDVPMPRTAGGERLVDLVLDPAGERLFLVFEDGIAWRPVDVSADDAPSSRPDGSRSSWRIERPGLPPGARPRRLRWGAGRVWLVSDHGVLEGDTIAGPFRRTGNPVGTTDCFDLRAGTGRIGMSSPGPIVLCRSGLYARGEGPGPGVAGNASVRPGLRVVLPPAGPSLVEIRRHAIERAGLSVARAGSMWRRLRRRGLWPEIDLSFDLDFESDLERDRDQAFVSGDTRRLFDRTKDEGRRYRAGLRFGWDLGEAVYPDETVDLSRELRQIISLRDDVLDEINQLYFERERIRERLSASSPMSPDEVSQLRWRALELDAGLDAWTGGWIHRWRRARRSSSASDSGPSGSEGFPGPAPHPTTDHGREIHGSTNE